MYYCGIDVAKRKHAIALLDEHGQPVHRPFTIENTRAGFDQLAAGPDPTPRADVDWTGSHGPLLVGAL